MAEVKMSRKERLVAGMRQALQAQGQPGEQVQWLAFGVKQPPILLILLLLLLAVLPGLIAVVLLTKSYVVGLTDRRLLVLRVAGVGKWTAKEVIEFSRSELASAQVKTSTGSVFTHMDVRSGGKAWAAKFHRAFSPTNREHAMAIAAAIAPKAA